MEGTQVIGWDPVEKTIRSWMFDSDGGFGQGVWTRKGDNWVVKFSQVLADGREASSINVYKCVDENTYTWKSVGREVGGEQLPNIEEIKVARKSAETAAQPAKETAKEPAKEQVKEKEGEKAK